MSCLFATLAHGKRSRNQPKTPDFHPQRINLAPEFLETPKVSYDNNDTSVETKLQDLVKKNKLHDFDCKLMRKDENGDFWYSCELKGERVKLGRGKSEEKAKEDSLRKMVDELRKGYGETELVNKCSNDVKCTEEEHQLNRRTEFIIVNPGVVNQ